MYPYNPMDSWRAHFRKNPWSAEEQIIYHCIVAHMNPNRDESGRLTCYPSMAWMARLTGKDERTVARCIDVLVGRPKRLPPSARKRAKRNRPPTPALLAIVGKHGRANVYALIERPFDQFATEPITDPAVANAADDDAKRRCLTPEQMEQVVQGIKTLPDAWKWHLCNCRTCDHAYDKAYARAPKLLPARPNPLRP
jgi:hypothetical protein